MLKIAVENRFIFICLSSVLLHDKLEQSSKAYVAGGPLHGRIIPKWLL